MSLKSLVCGFLISSALFVGLAKVSADNPPHIVGDSGVIEDIELVDFQGDRICKEPYFYSETKILRCE